MSIENRVSRRPRRHVVVVLKPDEWDVLAESARADERDPYQQARWLLLQQLGKLSGDEIPTRASPPSPRDPNGPDTEVA